MQLGCGACADIIHVSAQPVIPSDGATASTGFLSASIRLKLIGHAVPATMSPDSNPSISSVYRDQYLSTNGFCCCSNATAAFSSVIVSSYGSLMPSDGWCAFRYMAASAM